MTETRDLPELDGEKVEALLARIQAVVSAEDFALISAVVTSYLHILLLFERGKATVKRLRKLIFGQKSEKTSKVLNKKGSEADEDARSAAKKKRKGGNGRNGADAYTGAEEVRIEHDWLKAKDPCPECRKGKVYEILEPKRLVRVTGVAPLLVTIFVLQRLRCNLCGLIFTAPVPQGVAPTKYDERAVAMIALLKYGTGLPFNRLHRLQGNLGLPLPAATQWELVAAGAKKLEVVHEELIFAAAQGTVLHNDDTGMVILELFGARRREVLPEEDPDRTGVFTTGVVSVTADGHKAVLFFTGIKHAGENLEEVLAHRAEGLEPPIQMCDGLSSSAAGDFEAIVANCLAHARRNFVDVVDNFPEQCERVLEDLREVYKIDAKTRKEKLSAEERLLLHQEESAPVMEKLHKWMEAELSQKRVEPNSGLGEALQYMLKRWEKLTLFLHKAGAPLDNNLVERALKKAILNRKNAYFYKTRNGAHVGDLFMSLIATAELAGENPFEYLTELLKNSQAVKESPGEWLPWNFRKTLERSTAAAPG